MNLTKYNQVCDKIGTGDVLAFSGKGRLSEVIKNFTKSRISHVGMALWMSNEYELKPQLFVVESTTLNNVPDITGEYRKGVQIVSMPQRLEGHDGDVWWLPLSNPLTFEERIKLAEWLFQNHTAKTKYDTAQAVAAGIDHRGWTRLWKKIFGPSKEDLKRLFCSELVCKALKIVQRVPCDLNCSLEVPEDVMRYDCFLEPFHLGS